MSAPAPSPSPDRAAAPASSAAPPRKKGKERRLATRYPLDSQAELIRVPSSSRAAPIKVKVKDISATGVGILHSEPLPIGEKYVVKEPTISKRERLLFTVVRADQIGENNYSIGLHDSHLMGKDYKVEKRAHAHTAAMAKLLILAMILGGLFAAWTFM